MVNVLIKIPDLPIVFFEGIRIFVLDFLAFVLIPVGPEPSRDIIRLTAR